MTDGNIRVRGVARGVAYPKVDGYKVIPAWSRGAAPWRELSPFEIGPVKYEGVNATVFENFWQGLKVYERVGKEEHTVDGEPCEEWFHWRDALFQNPKAVRRPNGKCKPLYTFYEGEKLGLIEARKRVYVPHYQKLLRAHPVYQQLLRLVKEGEDIILLEPDGPCPIQNPDGVEFTLTELVALQEETQTPEGKYKPYGHGYVIALTLLQDLETPATKRVKECSDD